jgi:ribosomal protein S1
MTTVARVTAGKVTLEIEPGVEGELVFTEEDLTNQRQQVSVGQQLRVAVLDIEPWDRRILLQYPGNSK